VLLTQAERTPSFADAQIAATAAAHNLIPVTGNSLKITFHPMTAVLKVTMSRPKGRTASFSTYWSKLIRWM
jgi:hypothetical protein